MTNQTPRTLDDHTTLEDFLREEGLEDEVTARATKRIIALQLQQAMRDRKISKAAMAQTMGTSRAQLDRVLDPKAFNVTLETLDRAARTVGRRLRVELA